LFPALNGEGIIQAVTDTQFNLVFSVIISFDHKWHELLTRFLSIDNSYHSPKYYS